MKMIAGLVAEVQFQGQITLRLLLFYVYNFSAILETFSF